MAIPEEVAAQLGAEAVGLLRLFDIDSTAGHVRLCEGEDRFVDADGAAWLGGKMVSIGEVEASRTGQAPTLDVTLSYTTDPDVTDLVTLARTYGSSAIDGRKGKLYFQYFGAYEEAAAPIWQPILIGTFTMRRLTYAFDGPQSRRITLSCEGPWPLRSKPVNGRYTDADQRRRAGGDPSLQFMPVSGWDDEPLFGL